MSVLGTLNARPAAPTVMEVYLLYLCCNGDHRFHSGVCAQRHGD